jgi:hypothetical protein
MAEKGRYFRTIANATTMEITMRFRRVASGKNFSRSPVIGLRSVISFFRPSGRVSWAA